MRGLYDAKGDDMRPLLTLCMIVKDEAHTIARTLRSAKPYVDRWRILDTGSSDGTQEVIDRELQGVDGLLTYEPFVDFAATRNALLETVALGGYSDFLLLLDADDILEGGEALRVFLGAESSRVGERPKTCTCHDEIDECSYSPLVWDAWEKRKQQGETFYLPIRQGACVWNSARVMRTDAGWRYVGAVHEVLCHPDRPAPTITIPGVTIRHDPPPQSVERSRARWERDALLLWAEHKRDPSNARTVFYLAKTHKCLALVEPAADRRELMRSEAAARFAQRIAMNPAAGFIEEVYDSLFERALLLGSADARVLALLEAHAFDPRRAEPLYEIALHYLSVAKPKRAATDLNSASWARQSEDALAFLFARRAWELPFPDGALFVNAEVYEWRAADVLAQAAWWMGEYEVGERAARQAVEKGPANEAHLRENLRFYEERKR